MSIRHAKPVTGPDGTEYGSYNEAAKAFGMTHAAIKYQIDTYGNLDRLGGRGTPVTYAGKTYPTVVAFSAEAGHSTRAVFRNLEKYGSLDRLEQPRRRVTPDKSKPVTIGRYSWPSQVAAAKDLGVEAYNLRHWLKHPERLGDRLFAAVMRWQAKPAPKPRNQWQREDAF